MRCGGDARARRGSRGSPRPGRQRRPPGSKPRRLTYSCPSGNRSATRCAQCTARVVLPTPAVPSIGDDHAGRPIVSSAAPSRARRAAARPVNAATSAGNCAGRRGHGRGGDAPRVDRRRTVSQHPQVRLGQSRRRGCDPESSARRRRVSSYRLSAAACCPQPARASMSAPPAAPARGAPTRAAGSSTPPTPAGPAPAPARPVPRTRPAAARAVGRRPPRRYAAAAPASGSPRHSANPARNRCAAASGRPPPRGRPATTGEHRQVELPVGDRQPVPAGLGAQPASNQRPAGTSDLRDADLELGPRGRRRRPTPDRLDELFGGHHQIRVESRWARTARCCGRMGRIDPRTATSTGPRTRHVTVRPGRHVEHALSLGGPAPSRRLADAKGRRQAGRPTAVPDPRDAGRIHKGDRCHGRSPQALCLLGSVVCAAAVASCARPAYAAVEPLRTTYRSLDEAQRGHRRELELQHAHAVLVGAGVGPGRLGRHRRRRLRRVRLRASGPTAAPA